MAALYWPSVRRLVPWGYAKHDSPTAQTLANANILIDEEPLALIGSLQWDLARTLEENADLLIRDYSLDRAQAEWDGSRWADAAWTEEGGPDWEIPALGWIHVTKFPGNVIAYLANIGLAQRGRREMDWGHAGRPEEWIGLHPALAGAYMTALAGRLSQQGHFEPLTDQADLRVATPSTDVGSALHLLLGRSADDQETTNARVVGVETYVMLALQLARPASLASIPVDDIVRCRENLAEELTTFRAYVAAQQAELAQLAAIPFPTRRLEAFADHIKESVEKPLQQLEKGLRLHKLEPTRSLLLAGSLTTPPAAASAGLAAVGSPPAAIAATGVVVAVGNAWWQVGRVRAATRAASPVGFLLDVRDQLTPKTLAARARKVLRGTY